MTHFTKKYKLYGASCIAFAFLSVFSAHADDSFAGHDSISPGFGNAARTNRVMHTITPWPKHAARTDIQFSGKRILRSIRGYAQDGSSNAGAAAENSKRIDDIDNSVSDKKSGATE